MLSREKYLQEVCKLGTLGGAVAEWSKALVVRENKRKLRDPRFAPLTE